MISIRSLISAGSRLAVLAFVIWMGGVADAVAQPACSGPNLVDVTFAAGTRWRFCWDMRPSEGLIINTAYYTDKGGLERKVLHRASIAQLHVVYHKGTPRFRDLTLGQPPAFWGLGTKALNLALAECSPGVLVNPKVCREVRDRGYAWKLNASYQKGEEVSVWSSSQLGTYNYIVTWTFKDDGSIEPTVGSTGALQIVDSGAGYAPYGTRLNPQAAAIPVFGIAHVHNVYFRLDFDIVDYPNNAVEQIFGYSPYFGPPGSPDAPCVNYGECGNAITMPPFATETYDNVWPFLSWRIFNKGVPNLNGRTVGYELVPSDNAHWDGRIDTDEPWSVGDLYVTAYDGCELLAFDNQAPYIPAGCPAGTPTHVLDMLNGQNVDGADVVVWYVTRFMHVPREEDQPTMNMETMGLQIQPRSWRHKNTLTP
jgi:primary-amine oxidase